MSWEECLSHAIGSDAVQVSQPASPPLALDIHGVGLSSYQGPFGLPCSGVRHPGTAKLDLWFCGEGCMAAAAWNMLDQPWQGCVICAWPPFHLTLSRAQEGPGGRCCSSATALAQELMVPTPFLLEMACGIPAWFSHCRVLLSQELQD